MVGGDKEEMPEQRNHVLGKRCFVINNDRVKSSRQNAIISDC